MAADWDKIKQTYGAAQECPAGERPAFLDVACGSDLELRAEVEALLAFDARAAGFIEPPTTPLVPRRVGQGSVDLLVGRQIGSYTIMRLVASGGMGTVYEAEQERPRRRVALKLIRPGLATPSLLRRFEHEAQVLGRLQHPCIAQIYEAGTSDCGFGPQPFFAMEFVNGPNLTEFAAARRLDVRARVELMIQVCEAVHHAHQMGIVHRDLKPANILVADELQIADCRLQIEDGPRTPHKSAIGNLQSAIPKVIDFGVARVIDAGVQLSTLQTDAGQLVGTLAYMSPEQAAGDSERIDTRSDVYALGVLLYELITGKPPYDVRGRSLPEAARVIRDEEPLRLGSVDRSLRGDLETIVAKALEKDRTRRYSAASELAGDLRRSLNDEPIAARPPSALYQISKFAKRNKVLVGGVTGVFLSLVAGLVVSLALYVQARAAREAERVQRAVAEDRRIEADGARERAEREATKASTVVDLLHDVFSAAGPHELHGPNYTVRELLNDSVTRLEGRLAGEPEVEAVVRSTIGDAYRSLGEFALAAPHLASAHEINQRTLGPFHERTIDSALSLAWLQHDQGRYADAEAAFRETLTTARAALGNENLRVVQALGGLAEIVRHLGDLATAEALGREALDLQRQLVGRVDSEVAARMDFLSLVLNELGDHAGAESLAREAYDGLLGVVGPHHADLVPYLEHLAQRLAKRAAFDEAERLAREALGISRATFGDEHDGVAKSRACLGVVLHDKGDYAEAEALFREALSIRRRTYGDRHAFVGEILAGLGNALQGRGEHAEAEACFRESLAIYRDQFGNHHYLTARGMNELASLLHQRARYPEAEPLFREALQIRRELFGERHPDTAASISSMAKVLQKRGSYDEAESYYRQALGIQRDLFGERHLTVGGTLEELGKLLCDKGDYAAAEPLLREGLALNRDLLGEDHVRVGVSLRNLALALGRRGQSDQAESLAREALVVFRKRLGDDHAFVAAVMNDLAHLRRVGGDFGGAEQLLDEALLIARARFGDEHPNVATNLFNLATVRTALGKDNSAEALYREALAVQRKLLGPDHPDVAGTLTGLGTLLVRARDDPGAAEPLLREALSIRRAKLPAEHLGLSETLIPLAAAVRAQDRLAEADALAREALLIRRRALRTEDWRIGEAEAELGACLAAEECFEEAESLLLDSVDCLTAAAAPTAPRRRALQYLIQLYEAWDAPGEAAQWRATLDGG